jgi:hypothetical protein
MLPYKVLGPSTPANLIPRAGPQVVVEDGASLRLESSTIQRCGNAGVHAQGLELEEVRPLSGAESARVSRNRSTVRTDVTAGPNLSKVRVRAQVRVGDQGWG